MELTAPPSRGQKNITYCTEAQVLESFLVSQQSWALVDSKQVLHVLVCVLRLWARLLQASISESWNSPDRHCLSQRQAGGTWAVTSASGLPGVSSHLAQDFVYIVTSTKQLPGLAHLNQA